MFWWYISCASCATISACGSCSAVPYSMFFIATSALDVSSDACNEMTSNRSAQNPCLQGAGGQHGFCKFCSFSGVATKPLTVNMQHRPTPGGGGGGAWAGVNIGSAKFVQFLRLRPNQWV